MSDYKSVKMPLETKVDFEALNSCEITSAPCKNLIGCLMYVMLCTRPDLSFCVNVLSRFASKNNEALWLHLKRVLRYLKGTINLHSQ